MGIVKDIAFDSEGREKLMSGIDTLGPCRKCVECFENL